MLDDTEVVDHKCSKCVNANNPVVCSWIMKDIAEEKGCDFWQDSSEDITHAGQERIHEDKSNAVRYADIHNL